MYIWCILNMYTKVVRYKTCILFVYKKYTNHASILIREVSVLICMSAYPFHTHTLDIFKTCLHWPRVHVAGENDEKHPAYIRFVSLTVFVASPLSRKLMYQGWRTILYSIKLKEWKALLDIESSFPLPKIFRVQFIFGLDDTLSLMACQHSQKLLNVHHFEMQSWDMRILFLSRLLRAVRLR